MKTTRSIPKTQTLEFEDVMEIVSNTMWEYKDKQIQLVRNRDKKPYGYGDYFYTTANDLKWNWDRDWKLTHETKLINAPKGSKLHKCREWLYDQVRAGNMEIFNLKSGISSTARFKRVGYPWGEVTEKLKTNMETGEHNKSKIHINDGKRKAYCQSRKKPVEKKKHSYARPRQKRGTLVTHDFSRVTCQLCLNLIKKDETAVKRDVVLCTLDSEVK